VLVAAFHHRGTVLAPTIPSFQLGSHLSRTVSSMSGVVGDVRELTRNTITAKATHRVEGVSGAFAFRLASADGVAKYFDSHAKVSISGSVQVIISGPVGSTIASTAVVAAVPDKYRDWPDSEDQVVQLQGSIRIQHSLLVEPVAKPLIFGNETAEQLKPRTLVDYPPVIVGYYNIAGGTAKSHAHIVLEVPLLVEGVAHHKTW